MLSLGKSNNQDTMNGPSILKTEHKCCDLCEHLEGVLVVSGRNPKRDWKCNLRNRSIAERHSGNVKTPDWCPIEMEKGRYAESFLSLGHPFEKTPLGKVLPLASFFIKHILVNFDGYVYLVDRRNKRRKISIGKDWSQDKIEKFAQNFTK